MMVYIYTHAVPFFVFVFVFFVFCFFLGGSHRAYVCAHACTEATEFHKLLREKTLDIATLFG